MTQTTAARAVTGAFLIGVALPIELLTCSALLTLTGQLHPATVDAYLLRADLTLGYDPFRAMHLYAAAPAGFRFLVETVYLGITVVFAGLFYAVAMEWVRPRLIWQLVAATVLGLILYQFVPACGPYSLGQYAGTPPPLMWITLPPSLPRNALPSLHATWTWLIALESRRWPLVWRLAAWAFAALTLVACLGLGEHYAVDILLAVPFTALIVWLFPGNPLMLMMEEKQ